MPTRRAGARRLGAVVGYKTPVVPDDGFSFFSSLFRLISQLFVLSILWFPSFILFPSLFVLSLTSLTEVFLSEPLAGFTLTTLCNHFTSSTLFSSLLYSQRLLASSLFRISHQDAFHRPDPRCCPCWRCHRCRSRLRPGPRHQRRRVLRLRCDQLPLP